VNKPSHIPPSSELLEGKIRISLFRYILKNKWSYLAGIIFLISVDMVQIVAPWIVGQIIDTLKTDLTQPRIIHLMIAEIMVLAFGLTLGRFGWRWLIIGAARRFEKNTLNHLFARIIGFDQDFFDHWRSGDLMSRFSSDMESVVRMIGFGLIMIVDIIIISGFTITAMIFKIGWGLTWRTLAPLPVIALFSLLFGRLIISKYKWLQEQTAELSNVVDESVNGIQVIKVFDRIQQFLRRFAQQSHIVYQGEIQLVKLWGLLFPLIHLLGALSGVLMFYFGGKMVMREIITFGDFVMANSYILLLIWPMMALGWLINVVQNGRASLKRLNEIADYTPKVVDPHVAQPLRSDSALSIRNLSFKYPETERFVLQDISLTIRPGEFIAFVGRVGAGKSTLVKLLAKFYPVERGTIFWNAEDINEIRGADIREYLAYVPQDVFLFSKTIGDNVAISQPETTDMEQMDVLELARIADEIRILPEQLRTTVGERGIALSGGQKQRLTIARALLKKARFYIFDDCLSAVDTETESAIIQSLRDHLQQTTIIMISHRLKALRYADRIFAFDDGKIVESGTHAELLALGGIYHEMYRKQLLEEKLEEMPCPPNCP